MFIYLGSTDLIHNMSLLNVNGQWYSNVYITYKISIFTYLTQESIKNTEYQIGNMKNIIQHDT